MNKYQAISAVNFAQAWVIITIIIVAALVNNYWLLFLIMLCNIDNTEKRIMGHTQ